MAMGRGFVFIIPWTFFAFLLRQFCAQAASSQLPRVGIVERAFELLAHAHLRFLASIVKLTRRIGYAQTLFGSLGARRCCSAYNLSTFSLHLHFNRDCVIAIIGVLMHFDLLTLAHFPSFSAYFFNLTRRIGYAQTLFWALVARRCCSAYTLSTYCLDSVFGGLCFCGVFGGYRVSLLR